MSHANFELPTVGQLRLRAEIEKRPTPLDWAAALADREDLRTRLNRAAGLVTISDRYAEATEKDRDQVLAERDKAVRERDEAQASVIEITGQATVTDRALRRAFGQLTNLRTAASIVIDALDEGDIDTIGRIERLREAVYATTGESEHHTRMTLTEKAKQILDPPAIGDRDSVPSLARENPPLSDGGEQQVKTSPEPPEPAAETARSVAPERYLMATSAFHPGFAQDISRDTPDLVLVYDEDDTHWTGEWVTGIGFVGVRFPKDTTRELTADERAFYDGKMVQAGSSSYVIRIPRTEATR